MDPELDCRPRRRRWAGPSRNRPGTAPARETGQSCARENGGSPPGREPLRGAPVGGGCAAQRRRERALGTPSRRPPSKARRSPAEEPAWPTGGERRPGAPASPSLPQRGSPPASADPPPSLPWEQSPRSSGRSAGRVSSLPSGKQGGRAPPVPAPAAAAAAAAATGSAAGWALGRGRSGAAPRPRPWQPRHATPRSLACAATPACCPRGGTGLSRPASAPDPAPGRHRPPGAPASTSSPHLARPGPPPPRSAPSGHAQRHPDLAGLGLGWPPHGRGSGQLRGQQKGRWSVRRLSTNSLMREWTVRATRRAVNKVYTYSGWFTRLFMQSETSP